MTELVRPSVKNAVHVGRKVRESCLTAYSCAYQLRSKSRIQCVLFPRKDHSFRYSMYPGTKARKVWNTDLTFLEGKKSLLRVYYYPFVII